MVNNEATNLNARFMQLRGVVLLRLMPLLLLLLLLLMLLYTSAKVNNKATSLKARFMQLLLAVVADAGCGAVAAAVAANAR